MNDLKEIESAMEGILFASGEPSEWSGCVWLWRSTGATADAVAQKLMDDYSYHRRGIRLVRLETSYQLCSAPEHADLIRKTFESRRPPKLSPPALEVLAIIAYYQPTTRAYVDQVRGVDSAYTVGLLLDRELIEECGRLAVPGRPILYRTTPVFLRSFGLSSLDDLPELPAAAPDEEQLKADMQTALEAASGSERGRGGAHRRGAACSGGNPGSGRNTVR